ncbi:winged helix family two component transcriptional regulator [Halanaerobium saccharolyticum]|jgi:DNA-binding response OmpR family regulator|uniref:Stage 0 sporulation protein A homolog n=1 Tax=Halanaerobium saccharolyticum TaxID=43595 RepID=A0A2T5RQM7_9FIRM|nr:response regulator transcription factor [Halanaerobium saccharolyticum]PTW02238.1 winged helix family two component transcriptional regulator [Halanaerobium saccharolyticum]TDQ01633.1 winged helix family two component transcriptional regulator [Halanaerobium saccharolyticum]
MRILVVEDEKDLSDVIKKGLEEEGFVVDTVSDGQQAVNLAWDNEYDIIILDLMLPVKNGMEALKEIREYGINTAILILTAKDMVEDKIKGLNSGADDYLTKPFAFGELVARVRALLRRGIEENNNQLMTGDLVIDTVNHKVLRGGIEIPLTVKEYAVLEYLTRNRGQVLSRTQIEEHVWDYRYGNTSNIVDVYIRYLRQKIDNDFEPKLIETVHGRGYRIKVIENET